MKPYPLRILLMTTKTARRISSIVVHIGTYSIREHVCAMKNGPDEFCIYSSINPTPLVGNLSVPVQFQRNAPRSLLESSSNASHKNSLVVYVTYLDLVLYLSSSMEIVTFPSVISFSSSLVKCNIISGLRMGVNPAMNASKGL